MKMSTVTATLVHSDFLFQFDAVKSISNGDTQAEITLACIELQIFQG